jgi:hypothetical protein
MSIVVLTIPGASKRDFANALNEETGGKVDLVIVQRRRRRSLLDRFKQLYQAGGLRFVIKEVWFGTLLRIQPKTEKYLSYFRERSGLKSSQAFPPPKVMEVFSLNTPEVLNKLKAISPDLLVIWGSGIVKSNVIKTAKYAINLHMGFCPFYRGALANQQAVLRRNTKRIGATIHYAEKEVDTGDIIVTLLADSTRPPLELFRDLNDRAEKVYLDVAVRLSAGESLPRERQDRSRSENLLLKDWLPSKRYQLAKQIKKWEETGTVQG